MELCQDGAIHAKSSTVDSQLVVDLVSFANTVHVAFVKQLL